MGDTGDGRVLSDPAVRVVYVPSETHPAASRALVMAVIAWLFVPVIPALIAVHLARTALREIDASGGRYSGENIAQFARGLAWGQLLLLAFAVAIFLLFSPR